MRRYPVTLTSTHVDSQGEHPTRSALEQMARTLEGYYVPLGTDHDPRLPPIGRIASAEVKILEDGHHALQAVIEAWEDGDDPAALQGDGRTIPPYSDVRNNFDVIYDVPAATDLGLPAIRDLAAVAGPSAQPFYHAKKAVDPLSAILIAVGAFTVGGIAQGFFGKIGSDAAEAMQRKLKTLFKNKATSERLLVFHAGVRSTTGDVVVIDLILANPTESDITALFHDGFAALDRITKEVLEIHPNAAKIVVELVGDEAQLLFWVREDGVPSLIRGMASDELLHRGLSFSGVATRSNIEPGDEVGKGGAMKASNRWTCSTVSPRAGISVIIRLKREGMKHERPTMEIPQDLLGETRQVRDEKVTEICEGLEKLFNDVLK